MKHRLSEREIPEALKTLGDEVAARLPEPYDLIAEWAKYVPLDRLFQLHGSSVVLCRNNDDGTVTMEFETIKAIGKNYIIPFDLIQKTQRYRRRTKDGRPPFTSLFDATIFLTRKGPIRRADFFEAVADAICS
jgi:hypothetical protein